MRTELQLTLWSREAEALLRQRSPRRPDLCIASVPALRSVLDIPGHPHVPHSRVRRVPQSQMLFPSKRRPSRKTAHAFEWCSALTLAAHLFPALCAPPTKAPESESRGFSRGETAALRKVSSQIEGDFFLRSDFCAPGIDRRKRFACPKEINESHAGEMDGTRPSGRSPVSRAWGEWLA